MVGMPIDYYPQKSVTELLALLDSVQKRSSTGVIAMSTGAGMQQQMTWTGSERTSVELRRILYSLFRRDPVTYQDPYRERTTRVRPRYTM